MDKIINNKTVKIIDCRHRTFEAVEEDYKEFPKNEIMNVIHECDDIKVYQQKKGLRRFYEMKVA